MITKLNSILRRVRRNQEGGVSAEYVAVIVIVAAVIAAVWGIGIQGTVSSCGQDAVSKLFTSDEQDELECDTSGGGGAGGGPTGGNTQE